jgi:CheY-like chemotaxis protein
MPTPARILLVEDDAEQRAFYREILAKIGYEVVAVHEGEYALAILETERFDLLLIDMYLPGMQGDAVIRRAKTAYPAMKTILMSCEFSALDETPLDGWYRKIDPLSQLRGLIARLIVDTGTGHAFFTTPGMN